MRVQLAPYNRVRLMRIPILQVSIWPTLALAPALIVALALALALALILALPLALSCPLAEQHGTSVCPWLGVKSNMLK